MTMKICSKCKIEKVDSEFHTKKNGKQYSQCKECHREYVRKHYDSNKGYYAKKSKNQRVKNRKWFFEYKKTLKCEKCGENNPATLDFHHKNRSAKTLEVSVMINDYGIDAIMKEVKKCIILCSNCHRKLHWKEFMGE